MSRSYKGFVITMEANVHEDYIEDFVKAFSMVKGVIMVKPIQENYMEDELVKDRERNRIKKELLEFYRTI